MKKEHQKKKVIYSIIQYVLLFIPYVIILIWKRDEYFNSTNVVSMSFGCALCIAVAALIASKKIKLLKGIGGFVAVILISWLMDSILDDLTLIGLFGLGGYLPSLYFEHLGKREQKYLDAYITKEVMEEKVEVEVDG